MDEIPDSSATGHGNKMKNEIQTDVVPDPTAATAAVFSTTDRKNKRKNKIQTDIPDPAASEGSGENSIGSENQAPRKHRFRRKKKFGKSGRVRGGGVGASAGAGVAVASEEVVASDKEAVASDKEICNHMYLVTGGDERGTNYTLHANAG
ncbi:hypothetical protein RUND412_001860 [Rhizina undulata]